MLVEDQEGSDLLVAIIERRREKLKAMYAAITTAYSLVYRGKASPYSAEWRTEDHRDAFGRDEGLAELFLQLTVEDKRFCGWISFVNICIGSEIDCFTGKENYDDEDDVYVKKLFLDRRQRRGKRAPVGA